MASQSSQLPRALQTPAPQHHHQYQHHASSSGSASGSTSYNSSSINNGIAPFAAMPRRRVSYLIPPPPASQPPPLLKLPTGTPRELKARKRGNPNPLIMLADPDALLEDDTGFGEDGYGDPQAFDNSPRLGQGQGQHSDDHRISSSRRRGSQAAAGGGATSSTSGGLLSTSLTASSSSATSTSSRHYHSNNTTIQRHPEHTLGITALALDTSTIIDNSSSPSRKKTPGGILYSGGRDGLVASWELALPFKKRDPDEGFVGGAGGIASGRRKGRRRTMKKYLPRWAEDTYADEELQNENDDDDEEDEEYSSSDEETANAAAGSRRNISIRQDPYEDVEAEELLLGDDGAYQPSSPPQFQGASPRLRSDAAFGQSGITSGLQLDLNRQRERRRRSTSSSHRQFAIAGPQKAAHNPLPYENRWRLDTEQLEARTYQPRATTFRQAHRSHTNWVNDIVLCNLNQTVISASSDRMIRAWNPHDPHRSMLPAALGSHNDYVKCLTYARESGWVASGGFDRRIKIWDVMESRSEPISEYDMTGSVYALASNPSGSTVVAGSPEKVVRIFDPRAARGSNPVAGLVGHADNVRALLVSEDGRHVLSASSDSTVKVWSVSMRRCLHTFTHHSDSVWSLFSSHPHLEVFYSGDRTGTVCKVDFENAGDIATEGECVILLRNRDESKPGVSSSNDGIHRIVALDDTYLWTASNSSNICRWKDIPRKSKRQAAAVVPPALTRHDTVLASSKHYPASIPEHDERESPSGSVAPIPIMGTSSEENASSGVDRLNRARSNSNMSRDRSGIGSQHSVAFATSPFQRSSPQAGSPFSNATQLPQHQRPSSLRYSSANNKPRSIHSFSSSPNANTFSPAFSPPPRSAGEDHFATALTTPNTPLAEMPSLPSHNGVPLESLVPLFRADDPYGQTAGYGLGSAVGYSASVLSLHRTTSRPMPGSVTSPFGLGASYPTPPSSGLSIPRVPLGFAGRSVSPMPNSAIGVSSTSYHRPSSLIEDEDTYLSPNLRPKSEAFLLAQQEYEDRETAIDGTPLRSAPDDVIRGRSGLVRAELLNDRRTVISLDTQGEVAVWDIVLGSCIGRFPKNGMRVRSTSMLSQASTTSDGTVDTSAEIDGVDILETIRNLIEGEALVQSWCTVECRTGLLTVHIEQGRAFDAEVYLDEAGVPPKPEYRVDQRLNLGKWVLRNLFDPFVQEEAKIQLRRNRSGSLTGSEGALSLGSNDSVEELSMKSSAATPGKVPSHISLPDAAESQAAGFSTALATPAMTPAVLPDQSDLASQLAAPRLMPTASAVAAQLSPIPQSPSGASTVPATPSSANTRNDGDYFSRPTTTAADAPPLPNGGSLPTPRAINALNALPAIPSSSPASKVSKMSRFKSFGKKDSAKRELAAPEVPADIVSQGGDNALRADRLAEVSTKDAHLTPVQRAQQALLRAIFSHPLQPCPWHETPPIAFGADLPVMIEEESHDAGAWATVFRSNISLMLTELSLLEMTMPAWLLEFLCHNVAHHKDPVKIAFILEPHGGAEEAGLDALPSGNARLSATRMLRMRKACHYVAEKLELESWKQRQRHQAALEERNAANGGSNQTAGLTRTVTKLSLSSSSSSYTHLVHAAEGGLEEPTLLPEDEVEILCNGEPVPLNITLAACAKYCYGKAGDVYLTYRRRELDPSM